LISLLAAELALSAWGPLAGTEVTDVPAQEAKKCSWSGTLPLAECHEHSSIPGRLRRPHLVHWDFSRRTSLFVSPPTAADRLSDYGFGQVWSCSPTCL